MAAVLILACGIIAMVISDATKKFFKKNCPIFFTFVCCTAADIFFIVSSGFKFSFDKGFIIYSVLFAIAYAVGIICIFLSYRFGSFSLTGLIVSYSLLIPTFYGIIFLKESTSIFFYIGLALLAVAIFFISFRKKEGEAEKTHINIKWLIAIIFAFIGNGLCTVFQTAEQNAFNGAYKNEFMILALSMGSIALLIVSIITEREKIKEGYKSALGLGAIAGALNGVLNLCVMFSVNAIKASIVFPVISGCGLALTFIVARIIFKEKYSLMQYIGFAFSISSVVLLNL